jgi:hypothetical protein
VHLTENGDYLIPVPDEWIVANPLWKMLAPQIVEQARQRLSSAGPAKPTTSTSANTCAGSDLASSA